ncbi:PAS domain S-box protein [Methanocella sp. MCL-LM]|uniref:PAS domain S-box protein n=1 Tax=Methanocella sp. MCL-LM TaxID=3412035 RepID=UPI003C75286A
MKEKVLVVEDEAIVQLDIKNRLINLGYEIAGTTAYGEEAIKKVSSDCPDIVLMDIGLKGKIDGIEAASQIKALHNIPIVYMTANSDYTTLQKSKLTGPFGYILKPFDEREMRTTIEMALYKHKMDAELNETRHLLETTLDSISDAVISTNSQLLITYMNSAVEAITGWKVAEAQGKNIHDIVHIIDTETGNKVECPIAKVMETGVACSSKSMMTMISRTGARCQVNCTLSPIFNSKRQIDGVVFVFRDTTEEYRAMEAFRASESKLAKALTMAHMGNWDWDLVTDTLWLSDQSKKLFGIESVESEFKLVQIVSYIIPEDREVLARIFKGVTRDMQSTNFDFRIIRPDGELHYLHDEVEFIRDEQGNIVRIFGTAQDITNKVLVEQALRESEDKFSQAFRYNPLPMGITTLDEGRFVDINRRFSEVFGYTGEELIGKTSTELDIISSEDRAILVEQLSRYGRIINAKVRFRAKDGSYPEGKTSFDVVMINGRKHLLSIFTDSSVAEKH